MATASARYVHLDAPLVTGCGEGMSTCFGFRLLLMVLCPAVLVPFIALFFGVYPLVLNRDFALAATLYFTSSSLVTSVSTQQQQQQQLLRQAAPPILERHLFSSGYSSSLWHCMETQLNCLSGR